MSTSEQESPARPNRVRWGRWITVALGLGLVFCLLVLVPGFQTPLPPAVRRPLIEALLQTLLVAYAALVAVAAPAAILLIWLLLRARRRGMARPWLARLSLACGSVVFGAILLEASALALRAWIHRLPRLPTRFELSSHERDRPVWVPRVPDRAPDLPAHLARGGPDDSVYLVVIGESSAQGFPFHPKLSVGQIVGWQLEQALPGRRVEVNVLARSGATLEAMHHRLAELTRRPDALFIYCGHNEFQSRYSWSRVVLPAHAATAGERPIRAFERLESRSPLCSLIRDLIDRNRLDAPPPLRTRQLVDWPVCSGSEWDEVLVDFRRRLEAIVQYCEAQGTVPVLVVPPANESGFEPSRSVLPESTPASERVAADRWFREARRAENDPARAIGLYQSFIARYPGFAEAHFRLARLLASTGDWPGAQRHFVRARDADGLPLRCPTSFQEAYRDVAARHDCVLIDGPDVLRGRSPHGILGDDLFLDAHHPALAGHAALAEAVLTALRSRQAFGWAESAAPAVDPAACAAHFELEPSDWAAVCEHSSEFYRYSAIARYDPAERMAKANQFARAAQQIRDGAAPEATGVPGLGCQRVAVAEP